LDTPRTSTTYFIFDLEFSKRVLSSEPLNTKMPPISSFFGMRLVLMD
jgi:hypothetical protein